MGKDSAPEREEKLQSESTINSSAESEEVASTGVVQKNLIECYGVAECSCKGEDDSFYTVLEDQNAVFAGVMDGHCTKLIARWIALQIPRRIRAISSKEDPLSIDTEQKLTKLFKKLDQDCLETQSDATSGGSCVISCLITDSKITVANLGDCGVLLVKKSGSHQWLSNFLNAKNYQEKNRIRSEHRNESDYDLFTDGWVKGYLQPTRTIGDFYLKKDEFKKEPWPNTTSFFKGPYISDLPEFREFQRDGSEEFLVIASDGLWDFCSNHSVADLIAERKGKNPEDLKGKNIAQYLAKKIMKAARKNMTWEKSDDCTVMVIKL
jgi:pyruvate dehydrogenase phosphatase